MVNGLLLVDKPSGISSHDVVSQVRRSFGQKSVGHSGTLDPFASGLMVLLLGEGTKLSDYLRDSDKSYFAHVKLGSTTDTLDRTGQVDWRADADKLSDLKYDKVSKASLKVQGTLALPIPLFSAKKMKGRPLYDYARKGEQDEIGSIPKKDMRFYGVKPNQYDEGLLKVELSCGSGAFIRSWAKELGEQLQVGGHLQELRRTHCCGYSVNQAITLEKLESVKNEIFKTGDTKALGGSFISLNKALPQWKAVTVQGKDLTLLRNGQVSHDLSRRLMFEQKMAQKTNRIQGIKVFNGFQGELVSLLEARPQSRIKIRRVFRYES